MSKINKAAKYIVASALAGLVIGGAGIALIDPSGSYDNGFNTAQVQVLASANAQIQEQTNTAFKAGVESVVIPEATVCLEPVNETIEVFVDNGNLDMMVDYMVEVPNEINLILDGLNDNEGLEIVSRIAFLKDIKAQATVYVEAEIFNELDKEDVEANGANIKLDEDDMERLRIKDDLKDLTIEDVDFDDGDVLVSVPFSFEQYDIEFEGVATVKVRNGVTEKIDSFIVSLK